MSCPWSGARSKIAVTLGGVASDAVAGSSSIVPAPWPSAIVAETGFERLTVKLSCGAENAAELHVDDRVEERAISHWRTPFVGLRDEKCPAKVAFFSEPAGLATSLSSVAAARGASPTGRRRRAERRNAYHLGYLTSEPFIACVRLL